MAGKKRSHVTSQRSATATPAAKLPKLPVDIQAFEIMRGEDYLYVDKTRYIYQMVTQARYYFLARPRRFGKSLLVSTLKCLFEGRKELFEGLWIAEQGEWEWESHPVLFLDFNEISGSSSEDLKAGISFRLKQIAKTQNIVLEAPLIELQFQELIVALHKKTNMPVIVLIDEYDKRMIDHLGKGAQRLEIARGNRDVLKSFFGVLKGGTVAPILRFVFLTGISRFSKVSIFSELNNLNDISMTDRYAEMLGYTQAELETCLAGHIEQLAETMGVSVERLKHLLMEKYNGYRFSEKDVRVYNPFSILRAFHEQQLKNYWFESATPTFLINLLKEQHYNLLSLESLEVNQSSFTTFEIDHLQPEALLFQTGYVTIKAVHDQLYTLAYPNQEVKRSFVESLLKALTEDVSNAHRSQVLKLAGHLQQEDFEAFFETMRAIFAAIPYTINQQRDEAYFHTIFYLALAASGVDTDCEPLSSEGRVDLTAKFPDKVYVIEFKCNQSADAAIQQIRDKHYVDKHRGSGKKIFLVGINFSTEQKNLVEWKVIQE